MRAPVLARARRHAAVQERLIGPDGTFPAIGRSIAYRAGAFQLLAQIALRRALPEGVAPGQVRAALSAVLLRTLDAPGTFDANGWLRIGLAGHQPGVGERYISTGSLYLCATAFLPLGLPPDDPFWAQPAQPWTARLAWSGAPVPHRPRALAGATPDCRQPATCRRLIGQKDAVAPATAPSPMIDATALVKAAQGLDPLPATVARLASLVVRPDWSLNEAAHLVEFDPALTGRLLRLANSAAMAGLSPVNTARDAIMRVGIGPALAFAAASGLRKELKRALPEYGLTDGQLWRHSVASALAVEPIARRARTPVPPECFTAALLHDIGKIVLARFLTPDQLRWLADARDFGGLSSLQAETEVLGVNHADARRPDRRTVEAARAAHQRGDVPPHAGRGRRRRVRRGLSRQRRRQAHRRGRGARTGGGRGAARRRSRGSA